LINRLVIIDYEATCWHAPTDHQKQNQEIIEIGAAFINCENLEVVHELSILVKPSIYPILDPFCTELTTITQSMVDKAGSFTEANDVMLSLAKQADLFTSWGKFDYNILKKCCKLFGTRYPYDERHLNMKNFIAHLLGIHPRGIMKMCVYLALLFQGTQHRALADVKNILEIIKAAKPSMQLTAPEITSLTEDIEKYMASKK
jgi:inhibitor of KinA sporulation pathway (predicted exonuclease)